MGALDLQPNHLRIRHYGLMATRAGAMRARCHTLLGTHPVDPPPKDATWTDASQRIFGRDPLLCPVCHQARLVERPGFRPLRL